MCIHKYTKGVNKSQHGSLKVS